MTGLSLKQSRWAPSSQRLSSGNYQHLKGSVSHPNFAAPLPRKSSGDKRQLAQIQAYQHVLKSLRRLKWKSTTLLFCHHRALTQQTDNIICDINFPLTSDTGKANAAEIMFKVDFFEYYALLERVLVHLLACYGMVISADHTTGTVPAPLAEWDLNRSVHSDAYTNENSIIGDSVAFHGYAHRFHANVLAALDRPSNPLHLILGTGRVRQYLGIAKEFRNRWKEAELETADSQDQFAGLHSSYHRILVDLKLDEMLAVLLSALEESRSVASQHLASIHGSVEVDMVGVDDDDAWNESMVVEDAMDWG
ncbi:hypothetical protein LTR70_008320 [Exophiala xenobiotica]|uniref:Uncharacterized protein n=1 Tax=Lithohypha guttulata TaxID=1690604 RepID=A0ABR0K1G9_9EURO|nr:hypothetical protein LTR24_007898 [Lithohypha guttulata]KAK5312223.1 hypothetical protein LTR70_008320 [Exophiala xenobiotica]